MLTNDTQMSRRVGKGGRAVAMTARCFMRRARGHHADDAAVGTLRFAHPTKLLFVAFS
jgi:hypothetical protein